VWFSILVVEGRVELHRRLLLSVWIALGAVALLSAPASSLGAEPPVSFAAPVKTVAMPDSAGSLSGSLATADFNADGYDDAVAYSGNNQTETGSLDIAMSEVTPGGSEGWGWKGLTPPPVTGFAGGVVVTGQMNPGTDSRPDIVALSESKIEGDSVLAVYPNSGGGTFAAPLVTSVPGFAGGVAVGDVNGNGIPDVVIPTVVETSTGGWRAEVVTLLGRGNGEFEPPIESPIGGAAEPFEIEFGGIVIGDFTGSGHADIAVSRAYDAEHDAYVMSGDGTGHFALRAELGIGASFDVAAGDFNEDGHTDLALAIGGPELSDHKIAEERIATALGDGAGSFTHLLPDAPNWEAENPYSYAIRTADLNGDGRADLIAPVASDPHEGGVWALLGNGDGTFSTADREGLESENVWAAEAGDFDGDGRPDDIAALIAPGSGELELWIYDNTSEPALALGASSLDLGTAEVEKATTAPLAITNSGNYGLSVSSLTVSGADAADFSVSGCTARPVAPGATCDAQVRFAPSRAGAESATLTISTDDPTQTSVTIALSGTGTGTAAATGDGGGSDSGGGGSGPSGPSSGTPVANRAKETKGEAGSGSAGKLTLAKTATVSKSGAATLKSSCSDAPCRGKLVLTAETKKKVKGKLKTVRLKLGMTSYSLAAGKSATVTVKLSAAARAALASAPSHKLPASVAITPPTGAPSKAKVTLVALPHP
jgi:hypothetical protein